MCGFRRPVAKEFLASIWTSGLTECHLWVKLRRSQYEHMFSALPPNSDVARWQLAFRIRASY
jgi:hypothetical protein